MLQILNLPGGSKHNNYNMITIYNTTTKVAFHRPQLVIQLMFTESAYMIDIL